MLTYTKHTLRKLEALLEEVGYIIRYEKGSFQSGYCVVQDKKVAVINKFFETEGRINCLLDVVQAVEIPTAILSAKSAKFYQQIEAKVASDEQEA